MAAEEQTSLGISLGEQFARRILEYIPVEFEGGLRVTADEASRTLLTNTQFLDLTRELVNNFMEKAPDRVRVSIQLHSDPKDRSHRMIMEDNIPYDAQEAAEILARLNSRSRSTDIRTILRSTKRAGRGAKKREDDPHSVRSTVTGLGLAMALRFANIHQGSVVYDQTADHRIRMKLEWKGE